MIHFGKVLHASQYSLGRMYRSLVDSDDLPLSAVEEELLFLQKVIDAAFRDYNLPSGQWTSMAPDAAFTLTLLTKSKVKSTGNHNPEPAFFCRRGVAGG